LGIGVDNPQAKLDVAGGAQFGTNAVTTTIIQKVFSPPHVAANRGAKLRIGLNDGGFGGVEVQNTVGSNGSFNSQTVHIINHNGGVLGDIYSLTARHDGNIGIGITDPGAKLHVGGGNIKVDSGYGIDFSATANSSGTMSSELLDDYEEGTFTPTLTLGSGSVTSTISNTLSYTKIGRLVHILGRLHIILSATNVTSFTLTLPFTASAPNDTDTSSVTTVIRAVSGEPAGGIRNFRVNSNTATLSMQNNDGGPYGDFGVVNPHMNFNFAYVTDA